MDAMTMEGGVTRTNAETTGAAAARPRSIGVFCAAKLGAEPRFGELARHTGGLIARAGATLVYGGGSVGMMGALADGALAAGGTVVGVIPKLLVDREAGHMGLARLEVVADMQLRKQRMIEIADAFIALPGGLGTLDELFEVLTLRQLGFHSKRMVAVSDGGYYDAFHASLSGFVAAGLVRPQDLAALELAPSIEEALARLDLAPRNER
jgi:uncharacterized protein (TIGR00730 family)